MVFFQHDCGSMRRFISGSRSSAFLRSSGRFIFAGGLACCLNTAMHAQHIAISLSSANAMQTTSTRTTSKPASLLHGSNTFATTAASPDGQETKSRKTKNKEKSRKSTPKKLLKFVHLQTIDTKRAFFCCLIKTKTVQIET